MNTGLRIIAATMLIALTPACKQSTPAGTTQFDGTPGEVKLITLAPGHFHAALVQKTSYPQVAWEVSVYAPEGDEVEQHLLKIADFNNREENPTQWKENIWKGEDFLEQMAKDTIGNVVVIAGNNKNKTQYIKAALASGKNVLADKPMAIDGKNFALLEECFDIAQKNNLLLYDIMTERYEITTMLQKELSLIPALFGTLQKGTPQNPAIVKESVHHFFKDVAGKPLTRPAWFFDVEQEGDGMVDVGTHLVDLIQWECFPGQIIDYKKDINIIDANRYPTELSEEQFCTVTGHDTYPPYLRKYLRDGKLAVFANGDITYTLKEIHARISVIWNFAAPPGGGDTHYSVMRGTKANLVIRQGAEQNYKPALFIENNGATGKEEFSKQVNEAVKTIARTYKDVKASRIDDNTWEINIPETYRTGHEAHFGEVTRNYLRYLVDGKLPEWEVPNMVAKYYTTTKAYEMAMEKSRKTNEK